MITVRIFFAGFLFFLFWTLGVHLVTLRAMSFVTLYLVGGAALLAGTLGALKASQIAHVFTANALAMPSLTWVSPPTAAHRNRLLVLLAAGLVVFVATAALQYKFSLAEPFWVACLGVAAFALWESHGATAYAPVALSREDSEVSVRRRDLTFALAAIALLAFYFFTSVPDQDDSLFLNLAVGAKELRDSVFIGDTMLGIAGLDFIKSTYRLESYQLLTAFISDMTGLPVILIAHAVVPSLICIWTASILTLVHAALFPRRFGLTFVFHLVLLVALDGALRSYGYHAIPRFFQGKGPFVTTMIPLATVLTLSVVRTSSWVALALLAGTIVISIGFTANAVYVGPLAVALIGATWLFVGGEHRWRAFRLPLVILYPFLLALHLLINDPPGSSQMTSAGTIGGMLWGVFGSPPTMILGLALLFAAIISPIMAKGFRPISIYFALTLLLVLNPILLPPYAEYVTGYINYRLFWAVPAPFLIAVFFGLLWSSGRLSIRTGIAVLLVSGLIGSGSILNKAEFGFAALKVPTPEFEIAERIVEYDLGTRLLLAPESVSAWVTVFEGRPPVVEGRWLYIPQREDSEFRQVLDQRADLYVFWNRDPRAFDDNVDFLASISDLGVRAVLLDTKKALHVILEDALLNTGFEIAWREGDYTLLVQ